MGFAQSGQRNPERTVERLAPGDRDIQTIHTLGNCDGQRALAACTRHRQRFGKGGNTGQGRRHQNTVRHGDNRIGFARMKPDQRTFLGAARRKCGTSAGSVG